MCEISVKLQIASNDFKIVKQTISNIVGSRLQLTVRHGKTLQIGKLNENIVTRICETVVFERTRTVSQKEMFVFRKSREITAYEDTFFTRRLF